MTKEIDDNEATIASHLEFIAYKVDLIACSLERIANALEQKVN